MKGPDPDPDLAHRAWRAVSDVALDRDRKSDVSAALGLSWTRVLAIRQLATQSCTQRDLAAHLTADAPYVSVIVDDLEHRGLVRRTPLATDRRAKLVEITAAGRAVAAQADAILYQTPAALLEASAEDLEAILRVLGRLTEKE